MKHNFAVIVRDGSKSFNKVKELSKSKPFIEYDDNGNFCVIGAFDEDDIKKYEYYDLSVDWQTKSGFQDRVL